MLNNCDLSVDKNKCDYAIFHNHAAVEESTQITAILLSYHSYFGC